MAQLTSMPKYHIHVIIWKVAAQNFTYFGQCLERRQFCILDDDRFNFLKKLIVGDILGSIALLKAVNVMLLKSDYITMARMICYRGYEIVLLGRLP